MDKKYSRSSTIQYVSLTLCALMLFFIGLWLGSGPGSDAGGVGSVESKVWYCSMDPNIRSEKPGQCAKCGMDLIPLEAGGALGDWQIQLSPEEIQRAGIRTQEMQRNEADRRLAFAGTVQYPEMHTHVITTLIPGRVEKVFADYVGTPINVDAPLAKLFSPELYTTQRLYLEALEMIGHMPSFNKSSTALRVQAAQEKLRSWGLDETEIEAIARQPEPVDFYLYKSPVAGIVVETFIQKGDFLKVGAPLYTIAQNNWVWVDVDVHELHLPLLLPGQQASLRLTAYPGETFDAVLAAIDPEMDPVTQATRVRFYALNAGGRLQQGMEARLLVRVFAGEMVRDDSQASSWVCPIHANQVQDQAGYCRTAGVPLVAQGSLPDNRNHQDLIVPDTGVLIIGERAVAYVAVPGEAGVFEGRELRLGSRVGGAFSVTSGLQEGDQVVVSGAFAIDSALQLQGKKSMMVFSGDVEGSPRSSFRAGPGFLSSFTPVLDQYFALQHALSHDDFERAKEAATLLSRALGAVDSTSFNGASSLRWRETTVSLSASLKALTASGDLAGAREPFEQVSTVLSNVVSPISDQLTRPVYRFHCPMAFDHRGADWLQEKDEVENPYFGSMMFHCGEMVETIAQPTINSTNK